MVHVDSVEVLERGFDEDSPRPDLSPEVVQDGLQQRFFLVVVDLGKQQRTDLDLMS